MHRLKILPRDLYKNKGDLKELQQTLLRDDQTIKGLKNEDPNDLARKATVKASAELPEAAAVHVVNGWVRDEPGRFDNRWAAPLGPDGAWISLAWKKPITVGCVQITFDSGFQRQLTLSSSNDVNHGILRRPQPETVKDYTLSYRAPGAKDWTELANVVGNHQRLRRHEFKPVKAAACASKFMRPMAISMPRIYEVRAPTRRKAADAKGKTKGTHLP